MQRFIAIAIAIIIVGAGAYYYFARTPSVTVPVADQSPPVATSTTIATTSVQSAPLKREMTIIGMSIEKRDISAFHFGSGEKEVLFVGGIHGGYEWNTSLVAYELIAYLKSNPTVIPVNLKVTVIPVANPDGLYKVTGKIGEFAATDVNASQQVQVSGRFNANTVDLNRNFACDWKSEGIWQTKKVSGGTVAFSEPESIAIKNYVESSKPAAVVVWYSSAGGVFASNCHDGVISETKTLTSVFSKASGYPAHEVFDYYEVTGDMVNWLAKMKIPAISVLLTNHTDTEWTKNKAGIDAVLQEMAKK